MRYTRPDGLYWNELLKRSLTIGLKTKVTYNPVMPVIDKGLQIKREMHYTPFYGMNHLNRPDDDSSGGWCPQKGGDWGGYPNNPSGSGFPNQYQETTPVCDGLVQDIKMYANLDQSTWNSNKFGLQNAGTGENPQVYMGEGNQYGQFTDKYLEGVKNPHQLFYTNTSNPKPKKIQKINVMFERIGTTLKYVDPATGVTMPVLITEKEKIDRQTKIDAAH